MPPKAKADKSNGHTSKEINAKIKANNMAHGGAQGGAAGQELRKAENVKVMLSCKICGQPNFSGIVDVQQHYDGKHPKETCPLEEYEAMKVAAKEATKQNMVTAQAKAKAIPRDSKRIK